MVLVVGLDGSQEGEGHDRTDIELPGVQNELIKEAAAAAKVLRGGGRCVCVCVCVCGWVGASLGPYIYMCVY